MSKGQIFAKYKLEEVVGESQVSVVYKAVHMELDKIVALKIFSPEIACNSQLVNFLCQNARRAEQVCHANLVQIYESGVYQQDFYVVMQLVSGRTLTQLMERMGNFTQTDAVYLAKEVCKALQALHEKHILHGDLRPGNIFVTEEEEAKVGDFTLGVPVPGTNIFGNPFYIAPEVIRGERLDPRSDLYSLGATLFHLLTGSPPYCDGTVGDILQQHLAYPVPSARSYVPSISEGIDRLLGMLLAKHPQDRIDSAARLLEIFDSMVRESQPAEPSSGVSKRVEDFLMSRIAKNPEDRIYILDMLEAMAKTQSQNIPDEPRELMVQIVTQEFSQRLGCPPEIVEEVKRCHHILQNPKEWVNQQIDRVSSGQAPGFTPPLPPQFPSPTPTPSSPPTFASPATPAPPAPFGSVAASAHPLSSPDEETAAPTFRGRDYQVSTSSPDAKSNIIKSSSRVNEIMAVQAASKSPGRGMPGGAPMQKPGNKVSTIMDPALQKTIDEIQGKPAQLGASEGEGSGMVKWIFLFVVFGGLGIFGYLIYRTPELQRSLRQYLSRYGIVEAPPPEVVPQEAPKVDPAKMYAVEISSVSKLCQEKNFSRSRRALRDLKQRDGFPDAIHKRLLKQIEDAEKIEVAGFVPGKGWFGEEMPAGMRRLPARGEYLWERDESVMVFVPKCQFYRGDEKSSDASPPVQICLGSYYMDKYELTNRQYQAYLQATGQEGEKKSEALADNPIFSDPDHPAVWISWSEAERYGKWAQKRLPTELEWEKAARGGIQIPNWEDASSTVGFRPSPSPQRRFPWGDDSASLQHLNCKHSGGDGTYAFTAPVGSFPMGSSPYLCEDMAGNVKEWCWDLYSPTYYQTKESQNPSAHGPERTPNNVRVCRGGSWEELAIGTCTYRRDAVHPDSRARNLGARFVRPLR